MASVMKKTAIYGILRFCIDLAGTPQLWWAVVVLLFGVLSLIFGALFALSESDLKRILSYSSVENLGIILLGIGGGMVGLAADRPALAVVGFLAALYHALNHAFFKGLLFLGAGAATDQLGTSNLNEMGGLAKRMPWTALAFLTGALAASAIPPLNGFVSEWLTYQALFTGSLSEDFAVRALLPLCAVLLALGGALAAMVAVKIYGGAFAGPARSKRQAEVTEPPGAMLAGMGLLAAGCVLLGLGAPMVTATLANIVVATFDLPDLAASSGTWIYPIDPARGLISMPMVAVLLLGFLVVPFVIAASYGGRRAGARLVKDPWATGYGYSPQMAVSASSFDQPVRVTFRPMYWLRAAALKPIAAVAIWSRRPREAITRAEPVLENLLREPTTRITDTLARHVQALQMGDIRVYCFYIVVTLAVLLLVMFR
jgi:hydrogenase-4 component B